jgi:hypothetical protein
MVKFFLKIYNCPIIWYGGSNIKELIMPANLMVYLVFQWFLRILSPPSARLVYLTNYCTWASFYLIAKLIKLCPAPTCPESCMCSSNLTCFWQGLVTSFACAGHRIFALAQMWRVPTEGGPSGEYPYLRLFREWWPVEYGPGGYPQVFWAVVICSLKPVDHQNDFSVYGSHFFY